MTDAWLHLLLLLLAAAIGFAAWPALEYLIHGILSHRFRTFVSPLHWGHHKQPRGVLTAPHAWVPAAGLIWIIGALVAGPGLASAFLVGLLAGFARYERFHWRIHFREPRNERERVLFSHHLAHHFRDPRNYHGVTTRLFDRLFGTLPVDCDRVYASVSQRRPLEEPDDTFAVYRLSGLRVMLTRGAAPPDEADSAASRESDACSQRTPTAASGAEAARDGVHG